MFQGKIGPMDFSESAWSFEALSESVSLDRPYPPRLFGPNCPWVFGTVRPDGSASECGVSLGALTGQTVDAGSTTGTLADAARTEAADYWRDGVITITSGALNGQKRKVATSAPGSVTVLIPWASAPAAAVSYSIQRGCDKTANTCDRRFSNFVNFGGYTGIPGLELVSE
ncbi:MAG: phage BR0599 family protein [Dehalococcoidia bacterium]